MCIHACKEKVSTCTHKIIPKNKNAQTQKEFMGILAATTWLFLSITIISFLSSSLSPTQQCSFSCSFVTTSFSPTIGLNSPFPTQISFAYDFLHTHSPAVFLALMSNSFSLISLAPSLFLLLLLSFFISSSLWDACAPRSSSVLIRDH